MKLLSWRQGTATGQCGFTAVGDGRQHLLAESGWVSLKHDLRAHHVYGTDPILLQHQGEAAAMRYEVPLCSFPAALRGHRRGATTWFAAARLPLKDLHNVERTLW